MKKISIIFKAVLFVFLSSMASNAVVYVTSSLGNSQTASYSTLKAAFDAINLGVEHKGVIEIQIQSNTVEVPSTSATLNSSGAGPASYYSIKIYPTIDAVSISGNPLAGFGVIQLNGADNVTIEGDNPNTGGDNRNLTINNTASANITGNSVIRIAVSTAVTSADNIKVRNCNLNGNVTAGNSSSITSTTSSSSISFGIYCGGNGSTTPTGLPTAITSATTNPAPTLTSVSLLKIIDNKINQCARGIVINGTTTSEIGNVYLDSNVIGDQSAVSGNPPFSSPSTTVYEKGIWIKGASLVEIYNSKINNILSYTGSAINGIEILSPIDMDLYIRQNNINTVCHNSSSSQTSRGISVTVVAPHTVIRENSVSNIQQMASASTSGIDYKGSTADISKNRIQKVYNRHTGTYGAYGINITGSSDEYIYNNAIVDIKNNMSGGVAFSTTFGVHGIRFAGGSGSLIYHNTVNLSGTLFGSAGSSILTSAFSITSNSIGGCLIRNNIFSNNLTGGSSQIAHVSMYLPSGGNSSNDLLINNNAYYSGSSSAFQGIAQVGVIAGTGFYTAGNFDPMQTTPSTNFRSYTNTLNSAGTNDNASFATTSPAPFILADGFHITTGSNTKLESGAAGMLNRDIDEDVRPGPLGSTYGGATAPDIGADEFDGIPVTTMNLQVFIPGQGCPEDITVEFRDNITPNINLFYTVPQTVSLTVNGTAIVNTSGIPNGEEGYIVVKHRNSLETWSRLVTFTSNMTFSFKTNVSQAYCNNENYYSNGTVASVFRGDFNQDGVIDVEDASKLYNDSYNFVMGNVVTDLNCDQTVDIGDIAIMENSSSLFYPITVSNPASISPAAYVNRPRDPLFDPNPEYCDVTP